MGRVGRKKTSVVKVGHGEDIIQIKKTEPKKGDSGQDVEVVQDELPRGRSNAFKTGRYARLPALCNTCVYGGNEEVGGNGKCEAYMPDAVCSVREDLQDKLGKYDTRNPADVQKIIDVEIKTMLENIRFTEFLSSMDGNIPDKHELALANTLQKWISLQKEFMPQGQKLQSTTVTGDNAIMTEILAAQGLGNVK